MSSLLVLLLIPLMFHPALLTLTVAAIILWLLLRGGWSRRKSLALFTAAAAFLVFAAVDSYKAAERVAFARSLSATPQVHGTMPTPKRLVLVNVGCDVNCIGRIARGIHDEVFVVQDMRRFSSPEAGMEVLRYRIERRPAEGCPEGEDRRWPDRYKLRELGICPLIEEATIPADGVFIVREGLRLSARQPSAPSYQPEFLTLAPPGRVTRFLGLEIQQRTLGKIEVLAAEYQYMAPGYLGFPPLVGCWTRPDSVFWVLPAGDTGCGLWRRLVYGGVPQVRNEFDEVLEQVLSIPQPH